MMKHLLLTTIAAVLLVGCGKPPMIIQSVVKGQIEEVKQHLAAGAEVNSRDMYTEPLGIDGHYDVFGKPSLPPSSANTEPRHLKNWKLKGSSHWKTQPLSPALFATRILSSYWTG